MHSKLYAASAALFVMAMAPLASAQMPTWSAEQTEAWKVVQQSWVDDVAQNGKWPANYADPQMVVWSSEFAAPRGKDRPYSESLQLLAHAQREVLDALHDYLLSLGDDVQHKELKLYAAYKRLKNFATVVLQKSRLLVYLHLDPSTLAPLPPNARDVREVGHWGTGDLEITLSSVGELDALKPLLMQAYEGRAART